MESESDYITHSVVLSDGHSTDVGSAWFYLDACIQGKPCAFSIKTKRRTVSTTPKIPLKIISAISAISAGLKKDLFRSVRFLYAFAS